MIDLFVLWLTRQIPVWVSVVQMGEEYHHAKDYTKALK